MNRFVIVLSGVAALGACAAAVVACNGLLGIGPATLADDAGTVPPGPNCDYYCQTIMQNCQGANAEYLTSAVCSSMCGAFESNGAIADTKDDTLDCRIFNSQQAASDPAKFCRFAGPLGGGHCGSDPCVPFCTLDTTYCNGKAVNTPVYSNQVACTSACESFPYLLDAGDTQLESTDTLNCRLWHLEFAFESNENGEYHCPHTAVVSATCFNPDGGKD